MNLLNFRRAAGLIALLLWITSLLTPAVDFCAEHLDMELQQFSKPGLWFLVGGFIGVVLGWFSWLANPLLLVASAFLLSGRRLWFHFSLAPALFALIALFETGGVFHFDGGPYRGCGLGPGFWAWSAACILPLFGAIFEATVPDRFAAPQAIDQFHRDE